MPRLWIFCGWRFLYINGVFQQHVFMTCFVYISTLGRKKFTLIFPLVFFFFKIHHKHITKIPVWNFFFKIFEIKMKQVLKLSGWKMQEKSWETVYFWNIGLRNSLISCKNAVNANTRTHALAIQIYCKIELRLIEQWITGN